MNQSNPSSYQRVAAAIDFMRANFREQPSLDEVAQHIHLSPYHFQRLFSDWAGVSPKKFLQFLTLDYAKSLIRKKEFTLFDTAEEAGLSGTGRLHDLFIQIEGMTPGEYKNGGAALLIHYSFAESPFGPVLVASTSKGICHMAFVDDDAVALQRMQQLFPNARFQQLTDSFQQEALFIFRQDWKNMNQIRLHLKGTPFQLKVWEALLRIPMGGLRSYQQLAQSIDHPTASRAVGSAIGQNPVAFLIPCHRVIQSTGETGNYYWGSQRKALMIGWEAGRENLEM